MTLKEKMENTQVGETFQYGNRTLKVIECKVATGGIPSCARCFFHTVGGEDHIGCCCASVHPIAYLACAPQIDKYVKYVEVEKECLQR